MAFWLPFGGHCGSQTGSEFAKKPGQNSRGAIQERLRIRSCFLAPLGALLPSIFGGSGLDVRRLFEDFSSYLASFGHFCWLFWLEGRRLPQTRPLKLAQILSYGTLANKSGLNFAERESKNLPKAEYRIRTLDYEKQQTS